MTVAKTIPAPLAVTLFGPIQVAIEGKPLPRTRSRKVFSLIALLALRHGRPVEREWLAAALWPDAEEEQALGSLRTVLSQLRQALGEQAIRLQSPNRHSLCLEIEGVEVDVAAFDAAIKNGAARPWSVPSRFIKGRSWKARWRSGSDRSARRASRTACARWARWRKRPSRRAKARRRPTISGESWAWTRGGKPRDGG